MTEGERAEHLRCAVAGDEDALQRLLVEYHTILHRQVAAAMGNSLRRHLDPDDVLQQAYIDAIRGVGSTEFDSPGGFYKWLERIALNRLTQIERDLKRKKRDVRRERHEGSAAAVRPSTDYPGLVGRIVAPDSTPSRKLARAEASVAVLTSLARLTDDQRRVIQLRFLESRSVSETAAALHKTEAAVHMLTHRGLKRLRNLMDAIGDWLTRG